MAAVMLDNQMELEALSHESAFLYQPHKGVMHIDQPKPIDGGRLHVAHYYSDLATHTSGIYEPDGFEPGITPVIAMHGALFTGVQGHNKLTAMEMMQDGALVIMFGQPHYHHPTAEGLGTILDANELHGMLDELETDGRFGSMRILRVYGESQAGQKALVHVALAPLRGRKVVDGHAVAPRFVKPINPLNVIGNTKDMVNMGISIGKFFCRASITDLWDRRHTVQLKDLDAHLRVLPKLVRGEPDSALAYADPDQLLDVDLYGHDGTPEAYSTAKRLKRDFSSMSVEIFKDYGHVDGITSPETQQRRREMVARAVAQPLLTN